MTRKKNALQWVLHIQEFCILVFINYNKKYLGEKNSRKTQKAKLEYYPMLATVYKALILYLQLFTQHTLY